LAEFVHEVVEVAADTALQGAERARLKRQITFCGIGEFQFMRWLKHARHRHAPDITQ
jgi:hypothetical protein